MYLVLPALFFFLASFVFDKMAFEERFYRTVDHFVFTQSHVELKEALITLAGF